MLAALALLIAYQARPITLELPIQRLDDTIKVLNQRQSSEVYSVAPNLGGEMVLVRAKEAPLETVLAKIAHCTHAGWVRDGNRIRLERSAIQERELELILDQKRREELLEAQESLRKKAWKPYRAVEEARRFRSIVSEIKPDEFGFSLTIGDEQDPMYRASTAQPGNWVLKRIAGLLDLRSLTEGHDDRSIVFSTHPFGTERPFPEEVKKLLAQYQRDFAGFTGALQGWKEVAEYLTEEPIDRILIHVSAKRLEDGNCMYSLTLHALSETRTEVDQCDYILGAESFSIVNVPMEPPPAREVKLSAAAIRVEKAYNPEPSEEFAKGSDTERILRYPENWPRFRYAWSEVLPALFPKTNLVANVSDDIEPFTSGEKGTIDLLLASMTLRSGHEVSTEGDWTTVRPRYPFPAGLSRFHRPTYGRTVRSISDGKPLSIEQVAALSKRDRQYLRLQPNRLIQNRWAGSQTMQLMGEDDVLDILGALKPGQRNRLLNAGGVLTWSDLGSEAKKRVRYQLLEGESIPRAYDPKATFASTNTNSGYEDAPVDTNAPEEVRNAHLTLLFPQHIDPSQRLIPDFLTEQALSQVICTFKVEVEPALLRAKSEDFYSRLVPKSDFQYLDPDDKTEDGELALFYPVRRRQVAIHIQFPNGCRVEHDLADVVYDPASKPLPLSKLSTWMKG